MPATFSINIGTQFESSRKPDILSVLKDIPDNTNKQISPRDIRDAFLSTWANSPFKQTQSSLGIEYIGIDSGNPSDRDIKQKILLGKRSFGNLDVMSNALLSDSTADIFIYNTKPDTATQSETTVAFLAGTSSALHAYAPYIQSKSINGQNMGFELRNPSANKGPISIYSSTGRVAINGILFPTVAENTTSASNGKILRYYGSFPNGYLKWDNTNVTVANLGSPNSVTNIYGGTVSMNGYEMEFVAPSLVPSSVGGIPAGFSFSATSFNGKKWPIVEVLRKLLYPYTPPMLTLSAINSATGTKYVEIGTTPVINLSWNLSIYPRTSAEYINDYVLAYTYSGTTVQIKSGLSFSGLPGNAFSGTASNIPGIAPTSPISLPYIFTVTDMPGVTASSYPNGAKTNTYGFSHSATASIEYAYPIYYGFSQSVITSANFNSAKQLLKKYINPYPGTASSTYLDYVGSGYLYFVYHTSFASSPSLIKDPNGFTLFDKTQYQYSSFGTSQMPGLTMNGFVVWQTILPCSAAGKFEFKF